VEESWREPAANKSKVSDDSNGSLEYELPSPHVPLPPLGGPDGRLRLRRPRYRYRGEAQNKWQGGSQNDLFGSFNRLQISLMYPIVAYRSLLGTLYPRFSSLVISEQSYAKSPKTTLSDPQMLRFVSSMLRMIGSWCSENETDLSTVDTMVHAKLTPLSKHSAFYWICGTMPPP
jgi:hypothetical protein